MRAYAAAFLLAVTLTFCGTQSRGAALFGFNEEFITELAYSDGFVCPDCSTNVAPIPLPTIKAILDRLGQAGIRANREILPVMLLADERSPGWIAQLLKQYMDRHMTVVLALGLPLPPSLSVTGNGVNIVPIEDPNNALWQAQSERIADLLVKRLAAAVKLVGAPSRPLGWMREDLTIEPFNEFDSLGGWCTQCAKKSNPSHMFGTPERAKILTDTIRASMNAGGIAVTVSAPSLVNVYKGDSSKFQKYMSGSFKYGPFMAWLGEYYALRGTGNPNIHLYYGPIGSQKPMPDANYVLRDSFAGLETGFNGVRQIVPPQYKSQILVTEAGFGRSDGEACTSNKGGVPSDLRARIYHEIVQSRVLREARLFLFWRLLRLDPDAYADRVVAQAHVKKAALPAMPKGQLHSWIKVNMLGCESDFGVMGIIAGTPTVQPSFSAISAGISR